jgi:oligopeptide transport system substrate-binding protein
MNNGSRAPLKEKAPGIPHEPTGRYRALMPTLPRPTRIRTRLAGTLAVAALALLVAGCSNNPYPPGQAAGSVMYRAIPGDLRTLDPSICYVLDESAVADLIYPCYFRYHYLKQSPYVLELLLGAEEPKREKALVTDVQEGKRSQKQGEIWTFRIKKGLRFQDDPCFPGGKGREISAADFLYSFRRMADPRLTPPCPVLPFFQDKIVGLADYAADLRKRKDAKQPIDLQSGVEGLQLDPNDPYTFRIVLNQQYPQLKYLMTMHFTTPLAHEAVERWGEELRRHPVGAGAYMLTEYSEKRRIVLVKNPNRVPEFYPSEGDPGDREAGLLEDAGKQLPLVDQVIFNFQRENISAWNLFLQGYLDQWLVTQENMRQVMSSSEELSPEMRAKGVRMYVSPSPNTIYFGFNMEDETFGGYSPKKQKLRQAISLGVDSQAFNDLFYQGVGMPAQWVIPPGIFGYEKEYRDPYRQYSVEKAKRLLAEAGYRDGIDPSSGNRLTMYYDYVDSGADARQYVGLLAKQMDEIGVKLEPRAWRDVIWQDRLDKGQFQFVRYGWYADYPDAENFLFMLYGPNKRPGVNHTAYNNPEYNRLFEQVRAMDDSPERLAIIRRMREIYQEDCPWVPIVHDVGLTLAFDWVKNLKSHGVSNDPIKYRGVDPARRVAQQFAWNHPNYWPAIGLAAFIIAGSIPAAGVVRQRRRRKLREDREAGAGGD